MSNQRLAHLWHITDVVVCGIAFGWAIYGLRGHHWLRRRVG